MGYLLELADGESWIITAAEGAKEWVEQFAAINRLNPSSDLSGRVVAVVRGSRVNSGEQRDALRSFAGRSLPMDNWEQGRIRESDFQINRETGDIIYYTGISRDRQLEYIAMGGLLQVLYSQVQHYGGVPFHAALVEKNSRGIVLCAKGDTGKTTCCNRVPPPWRAWCDDEVLVVRVKPQQYAAHAFPTWSEYLVRNNAPTWDVQESVPLAGIVFLEQSPADALIPLRKAQAAVSLNLFASAQNLAMMRSMEKEELRQLRQMIFDNVSGLVRSVPSYMLKVSLTGRFWEELERIEGMS